MVAHQTGEGRERLQFARDLELEAGSDAHYEDVAYYASAYAKRRDDVAYYQQLALEHGGPVLEYGCGSGRLALPLARDGASITGVDRSSTMLGEFRRLLSDEPAEVAGRVRIRRGDMRSLRLKQRFGLVLCTFNTFLHLYTRQDVERFLARVKTHIRRSGLFVFDVSIPDPSELARDPARAYHAPRFRHPTTGGITRYTERFDYDAMRQVLFVSMRFEPLDDPKSAWMTPLAHRQFYPQELEALLHYNGFKLVDAHGDFERRPPEGHDESLILHCRPRRG
jgi:SAM-dependent methyltransferase